MKKLSSLLITLGLVSSLAACNNGASPTQSNVSNPPTTTSIKNRTFPVEVKGNGEESNNITIQHIRLMQLTPDQINKANLISAQNASLLSTSIPDATFNVANGISGFPANFYNNASIANLIPLNQLSFGTCVTFSEAAALSYLNSGYTSTVNISPVDLLDAGYLLNQSDMSSTGWDGLNDASTLLNRLESIGYYENYNATNSTYSSLSSAYDNSGDSGDLTFAQLNALSGFNTQLTAYNNLGGVNGNFTYNFSNLAGNWTTLFNDSGSNNASLVTNALDNGQVVLLDFNVYDANSAANSSACQSGNVHTVGTMDYQYDSSTGTINQATAASASQNNTWALPTGCLAGGHQVWVIGYSKASDGSILFVIRNSWGNSGDQGQYYMTDTYLNSAATYAAAVQASN